VSKGEELGTPQRFKCRNRTPWWRVPGLARADILLTYMAGSWPRAALNTAGALYSNTLHGLRTHPGVDAAVVALMFHSSLTLLSVEVEGRSYGGGILKLEPSEMARVRVAAPSLDSGLRQVLIDLADRELRRQGYEEVVREIDRTVLQGILGLSKYTVSLLRSGRERLLERRRGRARGRGANERLGEGDCRSGGVTRDHRPDGARIGEEKPHEADERGTDRHSVLVA